MNENSGGLICTAGCWLVALLGGALVAALLLFLAGFNVIGAIFFGGVVFVICGVFLSWTLCSALPAPNSAVVDPETSAKPAPKAAAVAEEAPTAVAAAPAAEPAAAPKKKAEKKPAKKAAKAAAKPAPAASAVEESEPETLSAPRMGTADDLKKIKGVGPGLEKTLNELGFWHFDQLAAWGEKEVAWVDSRLKFKGRIERDDWISQAKALAEGAGS